MNIKERREELEQQLRAIALEKQKTLDSLNLLTEPKKRKRVYELLQLQHQQQDELAQKLYLSMEKEKKREKKGAARHYPQLRLAVGLGFLAVMILLAVALFQYQFQSPLFLTGLSVGEIPTVEVQDKDNKEVGWQEVNLSEEGKYSLEIHIPDENLGTSIAEAPEIVVMMDDAKLLRDTVRAKADYYTGSPPAHGKLKTKVVSVEGVGKVKATIHLPKRGEVNTIFRCDDFDQDAFECGEWEALDIPFEDTGMEIVFTVDHFSAFAAGEIVAIDALHLDANYNFISNIFNQIKAVDEVWSEPIAEGEFVRVTYERNLTDGRVIDIFVRSETMDAYVEVYEVGSNNLVGSSTLIISPGWKYITVGGLSKPADIFDLRITSEDPQAMVEFDYIHDNIISPTQADGMVVYVGLNNATARYRLWNVSNNLTPIGHTQKVGANGSEDIKWLTLKATYKRNEMFLATLDAFNDMNVQFYNASDEQWTLLEEAAKDASTNSQHTYDIAYEDLSGDALILYDNTSVSDRFLQFRIWNGTRFSEQNNITIEDAGGTSVLGAPRWVYLFPDWRSDKIMAVVAANDTAVYAIPWDGTAFDRSNSLLLTNISPAVRVTKPIRTFAWESDSGDGLAVYTTLSNTVTARPYSSSTGWKDEIIVEGGATDALQIRTCSDPASDHIGIIWMDAGNDINASMWDGSKILDYNGTLDLSAEPPFGSTHNVDCAWMNESTAMFMFADKTPDAIDYFLFQKPYFFNTTSLDNTPSLVFGSTTIQFIEMEEHPTTDELMVAFAQGELTTSINLSLIRWNSTAFVSPAESPVSQTAESVNSQLIRFMWFQYDPGPNVTTLVPALNSLAAANELIDIGGNVSDNLLLPPIPMYINITYPNGSNFTFTASNTTGAPSKFNFTFSTAVTGVFTVTFLANDSRNSINYTEKTNFTVAAGEEPSGGPLPLLISADIINLSSGTSSEGGGFIISSTTNSFSNGTSLSAASVGTSGLSVVNLSSGIININVSLLRNSTHGNYPNVTFAWVLAKSNGSTMLNTTIQNNTVNQSAFNYSFNANLLPDGIYNISVFVENISEGATRIVNYSRGFDVAVDRTPPNVTVFFMNTSNATAYRLGTATVIVINATVNDSITSPQETRFGIFNSGNSTEFNITATRQNSYHYANLALVTMTAGSYTIRLYANDTLGNLNNTVSNLSFSLNGAAPTPPLTGMPANGSAITNRTPIFDWFNSSDADGDVISYHIQVDDNARFNNPEINVSSVQDLSSAAPGNTTWYSTIELAVDTRFYWRVRANDSAGYGTWSNGAADDGPGDAQNRSNFTLDSLLSITMIKNGVEFGEVTPGTEVNTSDGDPAPFRAENTGNIDANVSLNASAIFLTIPINRSAYQFQIRENESNAFSGALSATNWTNMTNSTTAAHVVNLTWRNAKNDFLTDINLTIPSDEPSGFKTSTITFTMTRNE